METKKKEPIRFIAGFAFVLAAASEMAFYIYLGRLLGRFSVSIPMWIDMAGKVLTGVALFVEMSPLVLAGSAVSLISLIIRGINSHFTVNAGYINAKFWTSGLLWIIFWALVAISVLPVLNKKYARISCFAAGLVELLQFVVIMPEEVAMIKEYGLSIARICDIMPEILLAIGAILLGMALPEMLEKSKKRKITVKQPQSGTESKIEQLEKLNALLEKGYITKEEFDAKKDQIMNPKV